MQRNAPATNPSSRRLVLNNTFLSCPFHRTPSYNRAAVIHFTVRFIFSPPIAGYSYVDANGVLQTVTYTADDENGFRVSASNLPQPPKNHPQAVQDTPEVAAAKKNHLEELQKSQLRDQSNYQSNILSYKILPSYFSVAQLENDNEKNLAVREIAVSRILLPTISNV